MKIIYTGETSGGLINGNIYKICNQYCTSTYQEFTGNTFETEYVDLQDAFGNKYLGVFRNMTSSIKDFKKEVLNRLKKQKEKRHKLDMKISEDEQLYKRIKDLPEGR